MPTGTFDPFKPACTGFLSGLGLSSAYPIVKYPIPPTPTTCMVSPHPWGSYIYKHHIRPDLGSSLVHGLLTPCIWGPSKLLARSWGASPPRFPLPLFKTQRACCEPLALICCVDCTYFYVFCFSFKNKKKKTHVQQHFARFVLQTGSNILCVALANRNSG